MDNWEYQKYEPLFGAWYVKRRLGKGAMGQVYEIQREELGQTYRSALKIIHIPSDEDEIRRVISSGVKEEDLPQYYRHAIEDLTKEIVAMSRLRGNSNVVSYEDHMTIPGEDGVSWDILMRMELLTPLEEHVKEHPLREEDVLRMGIDLSRALELCDQAGIIHRDVKPDNIFYSPAGNFKLGDFGIARIAQTSRRTLSHKGTVTYMAPEVYRGEPFDASADVYSLGLVLYKYLNHGRLPFMPEYPRPVEYNDSEIAFRQRMQKKEMPLPADGSPRLQQIVMKACAPDPAKRYENAGQLREDLEGLSAPNNRSASGTKGDGVKMKEKAAGRPRNKRAILIAIVAAIVMAGVCIYALIPKHIEAITGISSEKTLYIGDTISPRYTIEPDWFAEEPISFHAVPDDVISVDEAGRVSARGLGEGTLEMMAGDYTQTAHITVIPKVTEISGVKDLTLTEGDAAKLKPALAPARFSDEPVSYESSDTGVASVSRKGKVSAKKAGDADITVSAGGCEKTIRVVVEEPEPVVTYSGSGGSGSAGSGSGSSGKSGRSHSSGGSGKSGGSEGYFDSSKDEYF